MKEIEQIYYNDFGVAFHWIKESRTLKDRVQMVFKETGFYFTPEEMQLFSEIISDTCNRQGCEGCGLKEKCPKFLLKTPVREIDLAVSESELLYIKDLVEGTLFQLGLNNYLDSVCRN